MRTIIVVIFRARTVPFVGFLVVGLVLSAALLLMLGPLFWVIDQLWPPFAGSAGPFPGTFALLGLGVYLAVAAHIMGGVGLTRIQKKMSRRSRRDLGIEQHPGVVTLHWWLTFASLVAFALEIRSGWHGGMPGAG